LTSCQGLEPRPPERDFFKFIYKDSLGFDSHILRFCGRLLVDGKMDQKRKFVIAYFLCDDTILVTLVPEENSGPFSTVRSRKMDENKSCWFFKNKDALAGGFFNGVRCGNRRRSRAPT